VAARRARSGAGPWRRWTAVLTGVGQICRTGRLRRRLSVLPHLFRNDPGGDGNGWSVDWPRADENLSTRLSELTCVPVSLDDEGQPKHRLTDPALFHCPFVDDDGTWCSILRRAPSCWITELFIERRISLGR